jgi:phosphoribosyl 1,2-cyclic phosphodiesterase
VIIRGVRGSLPTPDSSNLGFGGNTCCLEVILSERRRLLLDCGSGLLSVTAGLPVGTASEPLEFDVFLTHYHIDHLQGLPFFPPLFDPHSRFTFYGFPDPELGVRAAVEGLFRPPWFPVSLDKTRAAKRFVKLDDIPLRVGGLTVSAARLNHPQGVTGYRLEGERGSLVLATDIEHGEPESDARLCSLAAGADVLVHDAQYTPEEYEQHRGWGHSTWRQAVETAGKAGVSRLVLFHHDPARSDAALQAIVDEARKTFPAVEAAREGMTFSI